MDVLVFIVIVLVFCACVVGIVVSAVGIVISDDLKERQIGVGILFLSIMILISFHGLMNWAFIETHYKINPRIEVVEYEDNYGKIYKDTVYIYKPKFR